MESILAAGAVVARKGLEGTEVVLVHRPKYDDWSFPKGKRDPGEHLVHTAVREVAEETGLDIRLGPPLDVQQYAIANGASKQVHYWAGRVLGGDVSTYLPNAEIDEVVWLPVHDARERLTYPHDRNTLAKFEAMRSQTYPLIVLRHGRAVPRSAWPGDDRDRPLSKTGEVQAAQVVPLLGAYGVRRIVSSTSRRCWTSVAPYAEAAGRDLEVTDDLSEEEATADSVAAAVHLLLSGKEPVVLCTHRPVLPWVFEALALEQRSLEPGAMLVVHHRAGRVLALEPHPR